MSVYTLGYIINESAIPGFTETNIISEDKKGRVVAEAELQRADELNRNKRIYPFNELIPQLSSPRILELLEAGYLRGEMGHPLSTDLVRQSTIDDTRTCVQFLKLWNDGPTVKCHYRGTNNQFGNAINEDLKDGCKPAFSLRALGSVVKTPRGNEVYNLRIVTYDCVIYPSHKHSYTKNITSGNETVNSENGILNESCIELPKNRLITLYESIYGCNDNIDQDRLIPFNNKQFIDYIQEQSNNIKSIKDQFDFIYKDIALTEDLKHVKLTDNEGTTMIITLEKAIHNDIMDYCSKIDSIIH